MLQFAILLSIWAQRSDDVVIGGFEALGAGVLSFLVVDNLNRRRV
jgi:hypothetical protein